MQQQIISRTPAPDAAPPIAAGSSYAQSSDFCRVFHDEVTRLFSLALLLTGDRRVAESCFLEALGDCIANRFVFAQAASSWARRAVIKRAITAAGVTEVRDTDTKPSAPDLRPPFDLVAQLPALERFVFAMTVLERYRIRDCATLLGCASVDAEAARRRALQHAGGRRDAQYSQPRALTV